MTVRISKHMFQCSARNRLQAYLKFKTYLLTNIPEKRRFNHLLYYKIFSSNGKIILLPFLLFLLEDVYIVHERKQNKMYRGDKCKA